MVARSLVSWLVERDVTILAHSQEAKAYRTFLGQNLIESGSLLGSLRVCDRSPGVLRDSDRVEKLSRERLREGFGSFRGIDVLIKLKVLQ